MSLALPITIRPFTRVLLLPTPDMILVDMMHQRIHMSQVSCVAPVPSTHGHLVVALAAIVILLRAAQQGQRRRRVGDLARRVGGDRCGRRWRGVFGEARRRYRRAVAVP